MMPKRRTILKLTTFLLLGAAVNVAVVFLLVYFSPTGWFFGYGTPAGWTPNTPATPSMLEEPPGSGGWMVVQYRSFGGMDLLTCSQTACEHLHPTATPFASPAETINFRALGKSVPSWSSARMNSIQADPSLLYSFVEESARGWPMLA